MKHINERHTWFDVKNTLIKKQGTYTEEEQKVALASGVSPLDIYNQLQSNIKYDQKYTIISKRDENDKIVYNVCDKEKVYSDEWIQDWRNITNINNRVTFINNNKKTKIAFLIDENGEIIKYNDKYYFSDLRDLRGHRGVVILKGNGTKTDKRKFNLMNENFEYLFDEWFLINDEGYDEATKSKMDYILNNLLNNKKILTCYIGDGESEFNNCYLKNESDNEINIIKNKKDFKIIKTLTMPDGREEEIDIIRKDRGMNFLKGDASGYYYSQEKRKWERHDKDYYDYYMKYNPDDWWCHFVICKNNKLYVTDRYFNVIIFDNGTKEGIYEFDTDPLPTCDRYKGMPCCAVLFNDGKCNLYDISETKALFETDYDDIDTNGWRSYINVINGDETKLLSKSDITECLI